MGIQRSNLGLPIPWARVKKWIDNASITIPKNSPQNVVISKKCPEIHKLESYANNPPETFWNSFPSNFPPRQVRQSVNIDAFKNYIQSCEKDWSIHQKSVASRAVANLEFGTSSPLKYAPSYNAKNANSSVSNGEMITDTVASWVKKGYVIGPFDEPPFPNFQTSPLMAAIKKNKVCPILNLSAPEGHSYNDALDERKIPKITMSSAKIFSQSLLEAGVNSSFAKQDVVDAYKLVPCNPSEWELFGFEWLGKFFVDITTPFGSKGAPANYDAVGETSVNIAKTLSSCEKKWIHRQLDDVPVISPKILGEPSIFTDKYREVCVNCNIPLADYCKDFEKAFGHSTKGTVLGIVFNSTNLSWNLPEDKKRETLSMLDNFLKAKKYSLLNFQKLHGKLNDFAQLGIFLQGFKFHQNNFLKTFAENSSTILPIPQDLKDELTVWTKCLLDLGEGLPIPDLKSTPQLKSLRFISDAAGKSGGPHKDYSVEWRGAASLGYTTENYIFFGSIKWPENFINKHPSDSLLLELIGTLIPFLCIPHKLQNHSIVLELDNIAASFCWKRKLAKEDEKSSMIIQILHLMEAAIPCKIFINHVQRRSSREAIIVDNFTRASSIKQDDISDTNHLFHHIPKGSLMKWLHNPIVDWSLPRKIIHETVNLMNRN